MIEAEEITAKLSLKDPETKTMEPIEEADMKHPLQNKWEIKCSNFTSAPQ